MQPPANVPGANLPGADTAQKLARSAPIDQVRPDMQMTVTAPRLQTVSATPPVKQISSPLPQDSFFYEQNAVFDPNAAAKVTQPTLEDALVKMQEDAAMGTAGEAAARGITGTQAGTSAANALSRMDKPPGFLVLLETCLLLMMEETFSKRVKMPFSLVVSLLKKLLDNN